MAANVLVGTAPRALCPPYAIGVHPYVTGTAHRIKYFEELYEYINRHDMVHWTGR